MQQQNQNIDEIQDQIEGSILKERFAIGRLIDRGSFGKVYKCIDLVNKNRPLVVKITNDYKQFGAEINAMRKIYSKQTRNINKYATPEVVEYGMILFTNQMEQSEELLSYMVMPRYG
jgi:serine/threonine protein kinase